MELVSVQKGKYTPMEQHVYRLNRAMDTYQDYRDTHRAPNLEELRYTILLGNTVLAHFRLLTDDPTVGVMFEEGEKEYRSEVDVLEMNLKRMQNKVICIYD